MARNGPKRAKSAQTGENHSEHPRKAPRRPKGVPMCIYTAPRRQTTPNRRFADLETSKSVKTLKMTDSGQILVSCCVPAGSRNEPKRRRIFKPRGRTIALVPIVRVLCSGCHSRPSSVDSAADLAKNPVKKPVWAGLFIRVVNYPFN